MELRDYYAIMGGNRQTISRQSRPPIVDSPGKYHPDVSKETDAEARFKEVAEAGKY